MTHLPQRLLAVAAVVAAGLASAPASAEVKLTFSKLLDVESSITYTGTELGDINVSSKGGKLIITLGALGVTGGGLFNLDPSVNKNQSVTFDFEGDVALKSWDLDDLVDLDGHYAHETFGLKVTPVVGPVQALVADLHSHSLANDPVGKSFTFGWTTDNYMIDTLVFDTAIPVVSGVPEPENLALLAAGMGVVVGVSRRRRA